MAHDWGHVMSSKVFKIVQLSAAHQLEIDTTQTVSNLPWSKFMQIQLSPQHFETSSSSEWVARHVLTSPLQTSPSSSSMARHWSKRHLFFARLASPQGSPLTRRLTSLCAVAQHRSIDSCGCLCRCRNVLWCVVCLSVCVCVRTHEGIVWKCKSPLWDPVAVHFKWLGTLCGTWYPLRQISSHPNSAPWQRNWPKMKCRAEIGFQIESARHFVPWCNTLCQTVLQSMRNKCLHQLKL